MLAQRAPYAKYSEVHQGQHILGVYPNGEEEIEDALRFLRNGLDRKELVMLVTDYMSKEKILKKMRELWAFDVDWLEKEKQILIKTADEWYFEKNMFSKDRMRTKWIELADSATTSGYTGIRVFADISIFFERGFTKQLISYENSFEPVLDFPITHVCAYTYPNMDSLSKTQFHVLQDHHSKIWI